jgi:hypothetical protein
MVRDHYGMAAHLAFMGLPARTEIWRDSRRNGLEVGGSVMVLPFGLWVMLRSLLICGWPAGTVLICYPIVVSTALAMRAEMAWKLWNEPNLPAADPRTSGPTGRSPDGYRSLI